MLQGLDNPAMRAACVYIALLVLGALVQALLVVRERWRSKVGIGDGGNKRLGRVIRMHGNYAENAPFGLALLVMLALTGSTVWPVHMVGLPFIVGRIAHPVGIAGSSGPSTGRSVGMVLTWLAFLLGAAVLLGRAFS